MNNGKNSYVTCDHNLNFLSDNGTLKFEYLPANNLSYHTFNVHLHNSVDRKIPKFLGQIFISKDYKKIILTYDLGADHLYHRYKDDMFNSLIKFLNELETL